MKLGTKSVLFGAHCFFLHPWFVARAWFHLYGFRRVKIGERVDRRGSVTITRAVFTRITDPRLWVAFFVHDLGYVGKPNMDGPEGELHPYWGAHLCGELFGAVWFAFVLAHSRYLAKELGGQPSALCAADKLAIAYTPAWLYLPMVRATGEIREYLKRADERAAGNEKLNLVELARLTSGRDREWYIGLQSYMRRWAEEHADGKPDTWTGHRRAARGETWPSVTVGDAQPARLSGGAH